jgi:hypothetical protein
MVALRRELFPSDSLIECKIWCFRGGDNEQCRLLEYEDALWLFVRTELQKTAFFIVSAVKTSNITLLPSMGSRIIDEATVHRL